MEGLINIEQERYTRHLMLDRIGRAGQQRIRDASVLVVGAGGLGCPVIQYLAAAGIGRLGIMDDDRVTISNLQRQVLFGTGDVDRYKAVVIAQKIQSLNEFVHTEVIIERMRPENAINVVRSFDMVVDCTDNIATRLLINDAAVLSDKTMIHGAVFKYEGAVAVFNYRGGPTYRCMYPFARPEKKPQPVLGIYNVLPGITGTLQVNETLKVIIDLDEVLSGKILLFNTLTNSFSQSSDYHWFEKNGKLYYNRNVPVYFWVSTSPTDNSFDVLLTSEGTKKYANPMYFDSEGYNTFQTAHAVDTTTKKPVYPSQHAIFKIYVDGYAPTLSAFFQGTKRYYSHSKPVYSLNLKVKLIAKDICREWKTFITH